MSNEPPATSHSRFPWIFGISRLHRGARGSKSAGAGTESQSTTTNLLGVADMLWDEYKAIHYPLPLGFAGNGTGTSPSPDPPDSGPEAPLDQRLRALYDRVHTLPEVCGRSALCLSGGGIRSAAFSLGVLQALARAEVLPRFHYLSTVSGGGYIGAWLTAWIHRQSREPSASGAISGGTIEGPILEVSKRLASCGGGDHLGGDRTPEPEQVAHLRRFTNYLAPHQGAFSLDTWTLAAVYLRNLVLNWAVVVPLLCAASIVPWLGVEGLVAAGAPTDRDQAKLATVAGPAVMSLGVWVVLVGWMLLRRRSADISLAETRSRREGQLLLFLVLWTAFAALVLYGPGWIRGIWGQISAAGGVSALVTFLLKKQGDRVSTPAVAVGSTDRLVRVATTAAAGVTITFILIGLAGAAQGLIHWVHGWVQPALGVGAAGMSMLAASAGVAVTAIVVSAFFAMFVDINEFSLHALYRNRLVRAFLRASRKDAPGSDVMFDACDDLPMSPLDPRPHEPDCGHGEPRIPQQHTVPRPFHVINATLNDVGGTRPEWNERKGVSFTFSPLHLGAHIAGRHGEPDGAKRGGYRRLREDADAGWLTLGTAMSISGAAANPSMGYHSSPLVTFLMALFNVRLGWWLPAPWKESPAASTRRGRLWRVWRAWWAEATGGTRLTSPMLNVSDGGHFDNLGLYEMVRRRCRYIVVVDAGQDGGQSYQSLAEAIRKIRIDFGIPVTVQGLDFSDRGPAKEGALPPTHAFVGTIQYSAVDESAQRGGHGGPKRDGRIVYIRPAITGDEPVDVQSYQRARPTFPHETTADQWFSESQFESYRALGEHSVQHLLEYYDHSKVQPQKDRKPAKTPAAFCHRIEEALAIMRRHTKFSSHAGGIVYRTDNGPTEFLLVRSTDQRNRILPKGHIEPGEDAMGAAVREVREETGYELAAERHFGIHSFKTETRKVTTAYFLMEEVTGAIKSDPNRKTEPLENYRDPRWFTLDAINRGKNRPPQAEIDLAAPEAEVDLEVPEDVIKLLQQAREELEKQGQKAPTGVERTDSAPLGARTGVAGGTRAKAHEPHP